MRRSNSLLGLLGLIFLAFALVSGYLTKGATTPDVIYIFLHLGLGLLALIAYFSSGVESLRKFVGERSTRYGVNAILYTLIFVAVLGVLNYLSARHNKRWDMSEQQVFSLSPQSAKIVAGLDKPLEMIAFVEGGINPVLEDLLRSYAAASPHASFRMADPDRDPVLTEQKKITQMNSVWIGYGEQTTIVTDPSEESITNALIKVTRPNKTMVCFVEGHGEPDTDDTESPRGFAQLKTALENENYDVKKVLLANVDKVPAECNIAVAVATSRPYAENELKALGDLLRGGGRVLLLVPPRVGAEMKPLLADWGVTVGDDVVVDQVMRLFQGPAIGLEPITKTYGPHEITEQIKDITAFPMTRTIRSAGANPALQVTELVRTSPSSWAETDIAALFERREVAQDEADTKGPVSIAVAVETISPEGQEQKPAGGRLVVFGSGEFLQNRNFLGSNYNRELFLNSIGWLSGQSDLVSVRPRTIRASRVQFTPEQFTAIFFLSVLLLPELLMILGITVWWRRSNA